MKAARHLKARPFFLALIILHCSFQPQTVFAHPENNKPYQAVHGLLTIHDLSNRFKVTMPNLPASIKGYAKQLNVAVIPRDSIGVVNIPWYITQDSMTRETESEFETEMLNCANGKDAALAETKKKILNSSAGKKQTYCERIGYGDGSAGHHGEIYYCSFVKGRNLVIVELSALWSNCLSLADASDIRQCKTQQSIAREKIESYFKNIIGQIKITRS